MNTPRQEKLNSFPLLRLPLELRCIIYTFALTSDAPGQRLLHRTWGVGFPRQDPRISALLFVNHQIHVEVYPIFYGHCQLTFQFLHGEWKFLSNQPYLPHLRQVVLLHPELGNAFDHASKRLDAKAPRRQKRVELQKEICSWGQDFAAKVTLLAVKCQRLQVLTVQVKEDRACSNEIIRDSWDVVDHYLKGAMGKGLKGSLYAMPKLEMMVFESFPVTATWFKTKEKEGGWLEGLENAATVVRTALQGKVGAHAQPWGFVVRKLGVDVERKLWDV